MSEVRKRRVHVRCGRWAGTRGWGYFADNQNDYDTVTVMLDNVIVPEKQSVSTSALGSAIRAGRVSNGEAYYGPTVRIPLRDLKVVSDLEAMAEPEVRDVTPPPRLRS